MNSNSKCWENFKSFIEDYYCQKLVKGVHYEVSGIGRVVLVNKADEAYGNLFDIAYESWVTALDLQEL